MDNIHTEILKYPNIDAIILLNRISLFWKDFIIDFGSTHYFENKIYFTLFVYKNALVKESIPFSSDIMTEKNLMLVYILQEGDFCKYICFVSGDKLAIELVKRYVKYG